MSNKNYYEILGVSKNATEKEIKSAYRKLAMQYHPDRLKDGTSDQKMRELNEAYEVLSNKEKRENYDRFGSAEGPQGFGGANFSQHFGGFGDFFSNFGDIFGDFGGFDFTGTATREPGRKRKGKDILGILKISIIEAINGVEKKVEWPKYELCQNCDATGAQRPQDIKTCSTCKGTGKVGKRMGMMVYSTTCSDCHGAGKIYGEPCHECNGNIYIKKRKTVTFTIPKGTADGYTITFPGYGERGINGGAVGALVLKIEIDEHPYFKVMNREVVLEVPVTFLDILNERTITIPAPYGEETYQLTSNIMDQDSVVFKKGQLGSFSCFRVFFKVVMPKLGVRDRKNLAKVLAEYSDTTNQDFTRKVDKTKL
ncbi:DnaJ domain-containing protein [Mycoplasmopsis columbinasalis]|uniref:Chaperone protein DnaJ n=1 Tax=Mycoplasmopsis columbinasalis TaxID=114880 RepID=A0A449BA55_9BACT|nr:DnaJ domain-containing protein [Mycoplasmopsis columbinasalis]VEU78028.1 chaperone protein [Mycoplasmopsis columbinasalis]